MSLRKCALKPVYVAQVLVMISTQFSGERTLHRDNHVVHQLPARKLRQLFAETTAYKLLLYDPSGLAVEVRNTTSRVIRVDIRLILSIDTCPAIDELFEGTTRRIPPPAVGEVS